MRGPVCPGRQNDGVLVVGNPIKYLYKKCANGVSRAKNALSSALKERHFGIWTVAIVLLLVQAFAPWMMLMGVLKWPNLLRAIEQGHNFWPAQVFMTGYAIIGLSGTATGVAIKTALIRHPGEHRLLVALIASLGCYIFAFFMARIVLEAAKRTPGQMDVFLVFYFGFYLLFLGWTTKPIWDRITDAGMKKLHRRLYGVDPS